MRLSRDRHSSSIGTTAATGAVVGTIAGAAAGAALRAAIGQAADDAGSGAAAGAAIGGATGMVGTSAGLSDAITLRFKKELAALAFEDRVIYPQDIQQGFIYLKWNPYRKVRIKLFNISDNKTHELIFDVVVAT